MGDLCSFPGVFTDETIVLSQRAGQVASDVALFLLHRRHGVLRCLAKSLCALIIVIDNHRDTGSIAAHAWIRGNPIR